jgi:hypothetical protein
MEGQVTQWPKYTWSLCYLSLHFQLLIAPLISFDHCVICPSIYSFCLPLWFLLVIVLSVPPFTASDCPLISFGHCVIRSSIYSFWLPLWYLLIIVLSVPPFTTCDCPFDILRGNQKLERERRITQWPKDTKGAIRSCNGGTGNTMTKRYQRGNQKL